MTDIWKAQSKHVIHFIDKENDINAIKDVDLDFDDIWKIENKNDFLIALNGWLYKKVNFGEYIEKLSNAEKAFFLVFQLEGEINNGGFSQLFYNSSGDFAGDTAAALREIGAYKVAEIYGRALAACGGTLPKNRDIRKTMLDAVITDEINEILTRCDAEFYEYPDDLVELNYKFIMNNKTQFTH